MLNKIHLGDCLEVMKDIPTGSVDMILADLPYGTTQNKWDSIISLELLWEQYNRVIKDNGAIVLSSAGIFTGILMMSNANMFKYKLIWEKSKSTNFLNAKKQPLRKYEDICIFYKRQPTYNPQKGIGKPYNKGMRKNQTTGSYGNFNPAIIESDGERYPTDIMYFKTSESEGKVVHPTQKPVALFEYLIKTYTNENETVLDNVVGSGTTAISCMNTNRNFIGIEKDKDYFNIANKRIKEHEQQTSLF